MRSRTCRRRRAAAVAWSSWGREPNDGPPSLFQPASAALPRIDWCPILLLSPLSYATSRQASRCPSMFDFNRPGAHLSLTLTNILWFLTAVSFSVSGIISRFIAASLSFSFLPLSPKAKSPLFAQFAPFETRRQRQSALLQQACSVPVGPT